MEQQLYRVTCGCGKTQDVTAGDAGSTIPCGCGRAVEVPSLGRLKASVGLPARSADLEVKLLLNDGSLPVETQCAMCDLTTTHQVFVWVECERRDAKEAMPYWQQVLGFGLFGWLLGSLLVSRSERWSNLHGRDVAFDLPVRVCEDCAPDVRTVRAAREVLLRTDLYARLLEKYPHAKLYPPS